MSTVSYVGRQFELGTMDCFTLLRDYYRDEYGLEFPNYARPDNFWDADMDLYLPRYAKFGFNLVEGPIEEGDLLLMAINSTHANHVAIVLGNGNILHHMFGRLSREEPYGALWRNLTVAVARHPKVKELIPVEPVVELDIRTALSERTNARLAG